MIPGSVYLWGDYIEAEDGYCAEFAYPKELFVGPKTDPTVILEMENAYGVPVTFSSPLPPLIRPQPMEWKGMPIVAGLREILHDVLYDTVSLDAAEEYTLFEDQVDVEGKTLLDTNMVCQNILPAPHKFCIRILSAAFFDSNGILPVSHPVYWHSTLSFRLSQKQYWLSPTWMIADVAAILFGIDKLTPAERLAILIRGNFAMTLAEPLWIEQQQMFSAMLKLSKPFPGLKFILMLEGERSRVVM